MSAFCGHSLPGKVSSNESLNNNDTHHLQSGVRGSLAIVGLQVTVLTSYSFVVVVCHTYEEIFLIKINKI